MRPHVVVGEQHVPLAVDAHPLAAQHRPVDVGLHQPAARPPDVEVAVAPRLEQQEDHDEQPHQDQRQRRGVGPAEGQRHREPGRHHRPVRRLVEPGPPDRAAIDLAAVEVRDAPHLRRCRTRSWPPAADASLRLFGHGVPPAPRFAQYATAAAARPWRRRIRKRPRYPTLSTGSPAAARRPRAAAIRVGPGRHSWPTERPRRSTPTPRTLPHNIEAEQALLGALLVNNDVYDRVASLVQAAHFFDPVHARIFEVAAERIRRNALGDPGHHQGLLRGRRRPARARRPRLPRPARRRRDLALRRPRLRPARLRPRDPPRADPARPGHRRQGRRASRSTASPRTRSSRPSRRSTSSASRARSTRASRPSAAP